jgi:Plant transposon protein.
VECAFGIMVAKWEILKRPIATKVELVDIIVKCICILHNTIIDREGMDHNLLNYDMQHNVSSSSVSQSRGRQNSEAKRIRDAFKEYLCENPIIGD